MSMLSDCCGAPKWHETDICSRCKEHTDFYDEETGEPEELDTPLTQHKGGVDEQDSKGNG